MEINFLGLKNKFLDNIITLKTQSKRWSFVMNVGQNLKET